MSSIKRATFRAPCGGHRPQPLRLPRRDGGKLPPPDRLYGRAPRGQRPGRQSAAGPLADDHLGRRYPRRQGGSPIRPDGCDGWPDVRRLRRTDPGAVPALPGDIVVLDRLQSRRGRAVGRAIRKSRAGVWACRPYSPDYNPIREHLVQGEGDTASRRQRGRRRRCGRGCARPWPLSRLRIV